MTSTALERVRSFPGEVGCYVKRLDGAEAWAHNADLPLMAASVIKLPVMVAAFRDILSGRLDPEARIRIAPEMKLPSCGALTYMHDGLEVTLMDVITLMIILSDNTAANLMIDRVGMDRVNAAMAELGIPGVTLRRRLFDAEAAARGLENTVTARGMGLLLERMYRGELLGGEADRRMLGILKDQRLNGKLPFYLHSRDVDCAHKTGEDDGITNDVGVVFSQRPFVICMLSNHVDVPAFERLIQDAARELAFGEAG